MNDYTVTTANDERFTVTANSTNDALRAALAQLKVYKLPVIVEPVGGTGGRLVMPDMSKGQLL